MSQGVSEKFWQAEARTQETKHFIWGHQAYHSPQVHCRRKDRIALEGIHPSTYYAWLEGFMEASKERLTRDMARDASRTEVQNLKRGNARIKQLVAELSLQVHVLKKTDRASHDATVHCGEWTLAQLLHRS